MPKISIIVPIYNEEKYLRRCIDSLLNQICNFDLEILLINDGSIDSSGNIAKDYALRNNKVEYYEQENKGLSAARNLGIRHATGNYIAFVDSDDYIEPNLYQNLLPYMEKNYDIVKFKIRCVDEEENIVKKYNNIYFEDKTGPEAFEALLSIHEVLEMSVGYVYRRDFFIDKHFEFKEGLYHEDFGLIPLVLTQATRVASVNVGYYNYVQTSQSITRGGISKVRLCNDLLLHYDNMIDYLPSLTLSRKIKREIKMFYSNCIIFSLNNLEENERKRYIKEIKRRKILYNIKIQSIKEIKLKLILHCNLERYLKLERHILL